MTDRTPKTVLVLAPHPDDAELYAGGTIAKLASEGAKIYIAIATDGSKGSYKTDAKTIAEIRAEEAQRAARVLGAEPPIFLNHVDMELDRLPAGVLREEFVRLIRTYRPDLLIAEDARAYDEIHPDHRIVARAALEAVHYARLPLLYPEQLKKGLKPHDVIEKYYYLGMPEEPLFIDIGDFMDTKIAAMLEHQSQVEYLVSETLDQFQMIGVNPVDILGEIASDKSALFNFYLRMLAAQAGEPVGLSSAEVFRYERFDPVLEGLVKNG